MPDRMRRLLGIVLLLGTAAFVAYRQAHGGWELVLPGRGSWQELPEGVYQLDLRTLAPFRREISLEAFDAVLLRHALRSRCEYSLYEDGDSLETYADRPGASGIPSGAVGAARKAGRNLYLAPRDMSNPRTSGRTYVLKVWIAVSLFWAVAAAVSGMILLVPSPFYRRLAANLSRLTAEAVGGSSIWLREARSPFHMMGHRPRRTIKTFYLERMRHGGAVAWLGPVCLAVVLAVLLCAFGSDWLYDPISGIDPYVYIGYGYNYPANTYFPGYYKISRLPWIFAQVLARRLLRSELATPIMAVLLLAAQGAAAYLLALRFTRNRTAAVMTGVFAISSRMWLNVGGWSYHAHPGGILFWLALAILPLDMGEARPRRFLAAFSMLSLGWHINPQITILLPMAAMCCLLPLWKNGITRTDFAKGGYAGKYLVSLAVCGVAASASITFILCLLHRLFYGEWLFFLPGLRLFLDVPGNKVWYRPMSWQWLESGLPHVSFLLAAAIVSLLLLFSGTGNGGRGGAGGGTAASPPSATWFRRRWSCLRNCKERHC